MASSTIEMSQNIRVKIDPKYKGIYSAFRNHVLGDFHELFFLCVCLGCRCGTPKKLQRKEDCFWSGSISPDEWYAYYAIYIHDNDMNLSSLGKDQSVIDSMQEYANAGIQTLIEDFLCDYAKQDTAGNYIVDHKEHIPKELLAMITMDWSE